jgi:hypothetical protein
MKEWMYNLPSLVIVGLLLVLMFVAVELGYRRGRMVSDGLSTASKSQISTIQSSLLGILALLLGFTFSIALQRFDNRSVAEVQEANSIGTAWLRSQLLSQPMQQQSLLLWQQYIDIRVEASAIPLDQEATRQALLSRTNVLLTELWQQAVFAVKADPTPVRTGLYVQALNDAIDQFGARTAELNRHVPELILLLLYITFILTCGVVGYAAGVEVHRPPSVTYLMIILIIILNFIIIDLDRPRRGLIQVNQQNLLELQQSIHDYARAQLSVAAGSNPSQKD